MSMLPKHINKHDILRFMSKKHRAPQTLEALIQHLQSTYAEMPTQFQISARYLIDHPGDIPIASMRTIAAQAGVQPATLVRLAQALGYSGWSGLKDVFVQSLRQMPSAYTEQAKVVVRSRNPQRCLVRRLRLKPVMLRIYLSLMPRRSLWLLIC